MPITRALASRRPLRGRRMLAAAAALAVAGALSLAGCATTSADAGDGPRIVATTTQVADFTRELLGDEAQLTQLIQPGQSAHSFDPSAAQLLALGRADALIVNGAGLETWIDSAIDASGFDGVLIDASTGIRLAATAEGHEAGGHDDDADDHDHGAGNPHIWTSVVNAEAMVGNIADGLSKVPGIDADALGANHARYLATLEELDAWIRAAIDQVPPAQRLLVTNHDAFTYFVDEYGVTFVGSVIPSFDDNAEPSAAQMAALVAAIRATGVRAVFSENTLSPKTAETIAREAGVTVYSGPDALYGDSLGAAGSPGASYVGSQIHNVQRILESWGASAPALPETLAS